MRPTLDHKVQASTPSVKFPTIGGRVIGSLVSVTEFQATDFATGALQTWPNGDPKMNKQLKLVLTSYDGVEFSIDVLELDVVSVYISGPRLYDYRDAIRQYMNDNQGKTPVVGTMVEVKFASEEPSKTKGFAPRKVLSFRFREEGPADKEAADIAELTYKASVEPPPPSRPAAIAPQGPQVPYEEPF